MAREDDGYKEGKDFVWVSMKDSKGNIVKDGKGNAVKTRKFGKNLAPESSPRPKARPSAPAAKAAPKSARGELKSGAGVAKKATVGVAKSGASRSAEGKVKPKPETPVPGRAIFRAIKNTFTGRGETDAAKITSGRKKD
jgi:hypothetical protein